MDQSQATLARFGKNISRFPYRGFLDFLGNFTQIDFSNWYRMSVRFVIKKDTSIFSDSGMLYFCF